MNDLLPAAIAANRFGLGARPGDLERIGALAQDWLRAQLQAPASTQVPTSFAVLPGSPQLLAQLQTLRKQIQAQRKAAARRVSDQGPGNGANTAPNKPPDKLQDALRPIYFAEVQARMAEALSTERPFVERLVYFWSNHFGVSADKGFVPGLAGAMEREAIRPFALGTFRDMLLAVESHPAMLIYLDNTGSTGPNSPAGRKRARRGNETAGINENLAREILELHTLGAGGPYTQQDVTTFAWVLSGWSVGRPDARRPEPAGAFMFRPQLHEPGAKTVLGKRYPDGPDGPDGRDGRGMEQGVAVLTDLAHHPATARHIATKLARHFVADDPPEAVIGRITDAFMASGGQLPAVYEALIAAPEAWERGLSKLKTPTDFLISSYRGLGLPVSTGKAAAGTFEQLGQRVFTPGSPAGWPDRSADWDGASALLKRIEWANTVAQRLSSNCDARALAPQLLGPNLTPSTASAIARASSPAQGLTLLLGSPEFLRR